MKEKKYRIYYGINDNIAVQQNVFASTPEEAIALIKKAHDRVKILRIVELIEIDVEKLKHSHECGKVLGDFYEVTLTNNGWKAYLRTTGEIVQIKYCPFCGEKL